MEWRRFVKKEKSNITRENLSDIHFKWAMLSQIKNLN